ncbi:hypothetical protein EON65_42145 [archaeon]|nr:MAG: hypothetical protein EON65_42145 [archaeon]
MHTNQSESEDTMLAAIYNDYTQSLQDVSIVSLPRPALKPHHVLVRVYSAGANAVDIHTLSGTMLRAGWKIEFPMVLGFEFSGVVAEMGEEVQGFQVRMDSVVVDTKMYPELELTFILCILQLVSLTHIN